MVVNELYNQPGYKPHFHNSDTPVELSFNFDDAVLKDAMKRLYEKKYNPMKEIDEELFNQFWDIYNDAADKGLQDAPPLDYGDKDADFYNELQYNNGVFAAFKTHRMQNDMASQLMGEDGKLKTFAEWEKDTRSIRDHHVGSWLQTEYNTAVNRAHIAGQWRQFEREKDILPNLEWMRTTSVTPGKDHEPFWGVILPIDHPFWTKHKPGDRWGCKCGLRSTDAPIKPPIDDAWNDPIYDPSVGLDNNPGKDAMLFSKKHSYVTHAYKGAKKVVEVYAPKIMANKSRKNIRDFFKKATENESLQVHVETNKTNVASISFQDVKKVTGKPHKFAYERNMLLHFLPEVLKRAKFIGSSQDKKPTSRGHSEVKLWHYYEIKINNEPSFIIVKETKKGEFTVHSIQDNDHFDRSKIEIRP